MKKKAESPEVWGFQKEPEDKSEMAIELCKKKEAFDMKATILTILTVEAT